MTGRPPAVPVGFRPVAAADAELAKFGFPPRPESATRPSLAQLWANTFGRDVAWSAAQLTPMPEFASRPHRKAVVNGDNSANWSGVFAQAQPGAPINLAMTGTWTIPQLTAIGPGSESIGIWIGLDGHDPDSPSLLQAGVGGSAQAVGAPSFFAWCEWLSPTDPVPAQRISNFPVQAGDVVEVQIWVTSPTAAIAVLSQVGAASRSAAVIASVAAPPNVQVLGATAEWVVERPLVDGVQSTLADYTTVTFTEAVAWTRSASPSTSLKSFAQHIGRGLPVSARAIATSLGFVSPVSLRILMQTGGMVAAGSGTVITMEENGTPLSTAAILGDTSFVCDYFGLQPGKLELT
jgi:hypothetical protein